MDSAVTSSVEEEVEKMDKFLREQFSPVFTSLISAAWPSSGA